MSMITSWVEAGLNGGNTESDSEPQLARESSLGIRTFVRTIVIANLPTQIIGRRQNVNRLKYQQIDSSELETLTKSRWIERS